MSEFIKGIKFCADNFTNYNLLLSNALDHTVDIFRHHLNELTVYQRPILNIKGEDNNQMVAHYRHNNEWKSQSELSILDEIYRDYEGNEPTDTFVYYLGLFHNQRLNFFNEKCNIKNHLGTNLRYTTYPERQIDSVRKVLEIVTINP